MGKYILAALLMTPTVLRAATEFQCFTDAPGKKTHVTAQLNFKELTTSGKLFTRAQVEVAGSKVEKFCAVFTVEKSFRRIGFVQVYRSQLSGGTSLSLTEDSATNEGPAEFRHGTLELPAVGAVPLSCVKKSS